ncbi:MAG: hypothetical protein EA356_03350 [Geminicoccaceae bacterium]|nr:MAG: hypothetical protein EA356_03350 [Geminicoccaceae bacterium]
MSEEADEAAFAYLIERVMQPGERLVWTGRASPHAAARVAGGFPPVAALVAIGVLLWLGTKAVMHGEPLWLLVAVLLVGTWVVTTPWRHRWRAHHLYYAVTDRRALVIEHGFGLHHHVLPKGPFERENFADGTASFQPKGDVASLTGGFWGVHDPDACGAALARLE